MRRLLLLLIVSLAFMVPPGARAAAPSDFGKLFASGVALYKAMDFEGALEQFQLARRQPHGATEEVQAAIYAGILQFELGREAQAVELFRVAASLDPTAPLPVKVSPRIEIAFEKERSTFLALMQNATPQPAPIVVRPGEPPVTVPPAPSPAGPDKVGAKEYEPAKPVAAEAAASGGPSGRRVAGAVVMSVGGVAALVGVGFLINWLNLSSSETDLQSGLGLGLAIGGGVAAAAGVVLVALPDGTSARATLAPVHGGLAVAVQGTLP
ncbi:MAG: tetratricopeptide repeat protein [Myxococcales bacterium]